MRKLVTTVATALTLGVMGVAAPALADAPPTLNGGNAPRHFNQGASPEALNGPANQHIVVTPQPGPQAPVGGQFGDRRFGDRDGFGPAPRFGHDRGFGGYDDHRFDRDNRFRITFDFGRHGGYFDRWERGWDYQGYEGYRYQQPLSYWRLVRRLEAQGFYGVRGLRPAQWGFGYRAFAFNFRGQPVMLRINPYTGRVLAARYIYS